VGKINPLQKVKTRGEKKTLKSFPLAKKHPILREKWGDPRHKLATEKNNVVPPLKRPNRETGGRKKKAGPKILSEKKEFRERSHF